MKQKYRRGVFCVVYSQNKKGRIEYLLLKRKLHWKGWEFPKGALEKGENILDAVKREIKEETGLIPLKIKKFELSGKYKYQKELKDREGVVGQTFEALCAVEVKRGKIILGEEHFDYKWMSFDETLKKLTWANQKKCLKIVNDWLKLMKFKSFITKSGTFIFIGKDRKQNEELVKKFIDKNNIIMHTAAPGSPFCVIDNLKPSKEDISTSGAACARYSQDWRDNKADVKVHVFDGKKVYKRKDMPVGTFGVKKFKIIKVRKKDIKKLK